jgi:predicted nucleic-acid-binding protein
MIALDTNALVRLLVEDDAQQAKIIQQVVSFAEQKSITVLVLPEVLLETVWVLESVYGVERDEIVKFLDVLLATSTFSLPDASMVRSAVRRYQQGLDFADALITSQAKKEKAQALFSFDKSLSRRFPEFVFCDFEKLKKHFR